MGKGDRLVCWRGRDGGESGDGAGWIGLGEDADRAILIWSRMCDVLFGQYFQS